MKKKVILSEKQLEMLSKRSKSTLKEEKEIEKVDIKNDGIEVTTKSKISDEDLDKADDEMNESEELNEKDECKCKTCKCGKKSL